MFQPIGLTLPSDHSPDLTVPTPETAAQHTCMYLCVHIYVCTNMHTHMFSLINETELHFQYLGDPWASLVAQTVKNLPAVQETGV